MANLQIVISALDKASGDINKIKSEISGVNSASKTATKGAGDFTTSITSMMSKAALAAGAVAAVGMALKGVYDSAKEAAELDYARSKFDNLSTSIGTVSDALLIDLRAATSGMVSDADLIAGAGDFMALGLAKTHDEVVRLSTVAGALNMNMNQLVLTLTNQTTMRFDALGVSVDGFDEKVKALKETGMDANKAFTEAFLQQAEEQIGTVGSAADSASGKFAQFEAAVENLSNSIKGGLVEAVSGVLPGLTEQANNFSESVDNAGEANARFQIFLDAMNGSMDDASIAAGYLALEAQELAIGMMDDAAAVEDLIAATGGLPQALEVVTDATNDAASAMQNYSRSLLFKTASEGLTAEAAFDLAEAMGLIDQRTVDATSRTNMFQHLLEEGVISVEEYQEYIVALADDLDSLESKEVKVTVETEKALLDIDAVKEALRSIERNIGITVSVSSMGMLGGFGVTEGERASGGPVSAGNPYLWQEYGYRGERFVPSRDGYVLSRSDAARAVANTNAAPVYSGPSAADIALAVRDAILMAGWR